MVNKYGTWLKELQGYEIHWKNLVQNKETQQGTKFWVHKAREIS